VAQFSLDIRDLVVDGQDNLYIADSNRIRKISAQGIVSTIAGSSSGYRDGDGTSAKFDSPVGLGIDRQGNIYVADQKNNRIRKISFE
jgi:DNA-binding beta-propeller fold protein YncE